MNRNTVKYFLTILFFFATAFCSAIEASPVQPAQPVNNETSTYQAKQVPNTELERIHPSTVPGGQIAIQKNVAFAELLSLAPFHQPGIAESSFIKASSLLVKDYLFHIYPSHNFW